MECSLRDAPDSSRKPTTYMRQRASLDVGAVSIEKQSFVMIESTPTKMNRAVGQKDSARGGSDHKNYTIVPLNARNSHVSQTNFVSRK